MDFLAVRHSGQSSRRQSHALATERPFVRAKKMCFYLTTFSHPSQVIRQSD